MTTLADYLNVPYRLESVAIEAPSGAWLREARLPELPGASVRAESIEEALTLLERCRVEIVLELLRAGDHPPVPRPPLARRVTATTLRRLGLERIVPLLDRDAVDLHDVAL